MTKPSLFLLVAGSIALVASCSSTTTPTTDAGATSSSSSSGSSTQVQGDAASCPKPTATGDDFQSCIDACRTCESDPKCDFRANPVVCTGGKLIISCAGECKVGGGQPSITCRGGLCEGACEGECDGKATPPGAKCEGKCTGTCTASCKAPPDGRVQCDGQCSGDYEVVCCEGGRMEGGCNVDAACAAQCEPKGQCK